jgi:hypothetical protein
MSNSTKRLAATWRRRVNKVRDFPKNTCPASRHLHLIADSLSRGKPYTMLQEEPEHCAIAMLACLAELWEYRTKDKKRTAEIKRQLEAIKAGKGPKLFPANER